MTEEAFLATEEMELAQLGFRFFYCSLHSRYFFQIQLFKWTVDHLASQVVLISILHFNQLYICYLLYQKTLYQIKFNQKQVFAFKLLSFDILSICAVYNLLCFNIVNECFRIAMFITPYVFLPLGDLIKVTNLLQNNILLHLILCEIGVCYFASVDYTLIALWQLMIFTNHAAALQRYLLVS